MQVESLQTKVPVRLRTESGNSLTHRFRPDLAIETRGVLSLDDDIFMPCRDVERGFIAWQQHPRRLTGYHPRLVEGQPLVYRSVHSPTQVQPNARWGSGWPILQGKQQCLSATAAFERLGVSAAQTCPGTVTGAQGLSPFGHRLSAVSHLSVSRQAGEIRPADRPFQHSPHWSSLYGRCLAVSSLLF